MNVVVGISFGRDFGVLLYPSSLYGLASANRDTIELLRLSLESSPALSLSRSYLHQSDILDIGFRRFRRFLRIAHHSEEACTTH